ncbi:hypothetical protein CFIMG_007663RA00001 [Ceratocystis fimbriata CBS 114723]|uniref:Uncharacterized protein n=1 Tax=Ceratocystis fimbriata CBS 114723 TaxID=1035309 RepID=A0A2C5WV93_9PEZI|nr:hypothetical protein CFIMG_007663RA00001 [Ceratocystis fimbriata CBS 114723]
MDNLDFLVVKAVKAALVALKKEKESETKARVDAEKHRAAEKYNRLAENDIHMAEQNAHPFTHTFTTSTRTAFKLSEYAKKELRQQQFTDISNAFDDRLLLPSLPDICVLQRMAQGWMAHMMRTQRADIPEPVTVVCASTSRGRRPSPDISHARRNRKRPGNSPPDTDGTRPIKAQSSERKVKPDGTRALVQTYHYMVTLGLLCGFISTGQPTIVLHVDYKEASELYFRLRTHQEEISGILSRDLEDPLVQDSQNLALILLPQHSNPG